MKKAFADHAIGVVAGVGLGGLAKVFASPRLWRRAMVCRVLFAGDFGSEREVVVNAARSSMGPVLMILFMLAGAVAARREPIEIAAIGVLGGLLACLGGGIAKGIAWARTRAA